MAASAADIITDLADLVVDIRTSATAASNTRPAVMEPVSEPNKAAVLSSREEHLLLAMESLEKDAHASAEVRTAARTIQGLSEEHQSELAAGSIYHVRLLWGE